VTATTAPNYWDSLADLFKSQASRRPPEYPKWRKATEFALSNVRQTAFMALFNLVSAWIAPSTSAPVYAANSAYCCFNFMSALKHYEKTKAAAQAAELSQMLGHQSATSTKHLTWNQAIAGSHAIAARDSASAIILFGGMYLGLSPSETITRLIPQLGALYCGASTVKSARKWWKLRRGDNPEPPSGSPPPAL